MSMYICTFLRMLGYEDALCAVTRARFGAAESDVPILMDNMLCRGNEEALDHCDFNGWGNHGCTHREDAGVVCEDSKHANMHTKSRRLFNIPTALKPGSYVDLSHRQEVTCTCMTDISCNV